MGAIRERGFPPPSRGGGSRNKPYRHSPPWWAGEQSMAVGHCAGSTGRGGHTRALPRYRADHRTYLVRYPAHLLYERRTENRHSRTALAVETVRLGIWQGT